MRDSHGSVKWGHVTYWCVYVLGILHAGDQMPLPQFSHKQDRTPIPNKATALVMKICASTKISG